MHAPSKNAKRNTGPTPDMPARRSRRSGRGLALSRSKDLLKSAAAAVLLYDVAGAVAVTGLRKNDAGQPVQTFRKELIKVGEIVKDGEKFNVTPATLKNWADEFGRMKAAGQKVPVPLGHSWDTEKNRGWVTDIFVEGDRLVGIIDLIGDDAIALAGRADVSIYAEPDFTDGDGNKYRFPIRHVAITTDPVVTDLKGFTKVELSNGKSADVRTLCLSKGNDAMFDFTAIKTALGIQQDITEANANDLITGAFKAVGEKAATAQAEVVTLKAAHAAKDKPREIDPVLLKMAAKNRTLELGRLVDTHKITPAQRDKLVSTWIGTDQAALKATLTPEGDALFDATVATLGEGKVAELARAEAMSLDRRIPGDSGDALDDKTISPITNRMLGYVNGTAK